MIRSKGIDDVTIKTQFYERQFLDHGLKVHGAI